MSVIRPFRAIRPTKENSEAVAALPYDVMNSDEARDYVKGNPVSFMHVDKAEVDLDKAIDIYDERVYLKARENLDRLSETGVCVQDEKPELYLYRQIMNGRAQTGIVGCASIDDYINNVIKKHEKTRADKELDRINHVDYCDANTGPIFLAYRSNDEINSIKEKYLKCEPFADFTKEGVRNTVWVISDDDDIEKIVECFKGVESLYIADGHHRAASAVKVGLRRREQNKDYSPDDEFNFFLAVYFDADELAIMDYNRVLADTNNMSLDELKEKMSVSFTLEKVGRNAYHPTKKHEFGFYDGEDWYKMTANDGLVDESDPVESLDVSILQNFCIEPCFGIADPRTDKRIDFVGGIRGLEELEKRCREDMRVAFSMYPTTLDELMSIADSGKTMPPKSTWFEPKLLSGLFIHKLS